MIFDMSASALIGNCILSAIVFALAYFPIATRLSRGLVSPYPKADVKRRVLAAIIDGQLVMTCCVLYWTSHFLWYLAAGAAYLLFRDAIRGQSVGKFVVGLVVVSLEHGRPCSPADSVARNLLLLIPGANVVALFLEARAVVRDPQGQRLGDRLAQTQVINGLGAKELVQSFVGFAARFDHGLGRRGHAPERIDRAA